MKKIKISPLSIIWIGFLIFTETPFIIPLLFAVLLHECGHLLCAAMLKIKIQRFDLSLLGARIKTKHELSYFDELIFALGGPLLGFLGFAFTLKPSLANLSLPFCQGFLFPFSILSLCLSIFNLIPLSSLDGGRILKCVLCMIFSLDVAEQIVKFISFLTLISLWMLSIYMMIKIARGLPMFFFCLIFFSKCFVFSIKNGDLERFWKIKRVKSIFFWFFLDCLRIIQIFLDFCRFFSTFFIKPIAIYLYNCYNICYDG